jgi:predicted RNA binding protein YcfA (HicA-like mRNA interferase family)
MAVHHDVSSYRLHVKTPGTDRLRKGAAGQLRHLEATGWHETGRRHSHHYVTVRMERTRTVLPVFPTGDGFPRRHPR